MNETNRYAGFETPLDAVLSGQFELCMASDRANRMQNWDTAFIRNGSFKNEDGTWSPVNSFPVSRATAMVIHSHPCVYLGMQSALFHYHTRKFPASPNKEKQDE